MSTHLAAKLIPAAVMFGVPDERELECLRKAVDDAYETAERDGFDRGVQHTVDLLAEWLKVEEYEAGDGSEDHDTDLGNTLLNILAAKGLYDREEGTFISAAPTDAVTVNDGGAAS